MKKTYIYGTGKLQADFEFIFDHINIDGYIDDESIFDRQPIPDKTNGDVFIYVCKYDYEAAKSQLEKHGYIEREDFTNATAIFKQLDYDLTKACRDKKLLLWGKGAGFRDLCFRSPESIDMAYAVIDNNAVKGEVINGIPVLLPSDIEFKSDYYCIVTVSEKYREVEEQLLSMGFDRNSFVFYERVFDKPSEMLLKTYYDYSYDDEIPVCSAAFEYLQIYADGNVNFCCPTWTNLNAGNLYWDHYEEIFDSIKTKVFRLSVINKTYTFCNREQCPLLQRYEKKREAYDGVVSRYMKTKWNFRPKEIAINIDNRCNLYCTSCRNEIYKESIKDTERRVKLAEIVEYEIFVTNPQHLLFAGSGEVFISDTYKMLIDKGKKFRSLMLLSNGNLFSEGKFDEYTEGYESVGVCVSVDAATKETYNQIRRGGNWEILMKNLRSISNLRKLRKIGFFALNYVVSSINVGEMQQFINLALELGVDRIHFTRISNWGTYKDEEFSKITIFDDEGEVKEEYRELFEQCDLMNPIVDSCNMLSPLKKYGAHTYCDILDYKIHDISIM